MARSDDTLVSPGDLFSQNGKDNVGTSTKLVEKDNKARLGSSSRFIDL